jgi:hypothetical protein
MNGHHDTFYATIFMCAVGVVHRSDGNLLTKEVFARLLSLDLGRENIG